MCHLRAPTCHPTCCILAAALQDNATLQYLDLEGNCLQRQVGDALAEAVKVNVTKLHLNVMDNIRDAMTVLERVPKANANLHI